MMRRLAERSIAAGLVLCFGLERPARSWAQTDGQAPAAAHGRERLTRAITALEAAGRRDEARAIAKRWLARQPRSRAALDVAVRLAWEEGNVDAAFAFSVRRCALAPRDPAVLTAHIELALARSKPADGFEAARRLARVRGTGADRIRYARMAEWSGRPHEALDEWWRLARERGPSALPEAERLARMVGDERILRAVAFRRLRRELENVTLIEEISALSEALGEPEEARRVLIRAVSRREPPRRLLVLLAKLEARMGRSRSALRRWAEVARRYGTSADDDVERADLAWSAVGPEAALAILEARRAVGLLPPEVAKRLARLGWMLGDRRAKVRASYALLERGQLDPPSALRLMQLHRIEGQPGRAVDVAQRVLAPNARGRAFWAPLEGAAQVLLRGLEMGLESGRFSAAGALVGLLPEADEIARRWSAYWQVRARLALGRGREEEAVFAIDHAIALNPDAPSARAEILWVLIQLNDRTRLRDWARRVASGAENESLLFAPLAAAFHRLGQPHHALPWYARRARSAPTDWRFWLSYATALDGGGRGDAAERARRYGRSLVPSEESVGRVRFGGSGRSPAERILLARTLAFDGTRATTVRRAAASVLTELSDFEYASLALERLAAGPGLPAEHDARLRTALATRNRGRAQRLLDSGPRPTPFVEAETEAFLGRFDRAVAVAVRSRIERPGAVGRADILRYLGADGHRRPNDVRAEGTYGRLGNLELFGFEARGRASMGAYSLELSAGVQTFEDRPGATLGLAVTGDFRAALSLARPFGGTQIGLRTGVHRQMGGSALPQVALTVRSRVSGRLELFGRAAANEVVPESPFQYTLMVQDRLALGGVFNANERLTLSGRGAFELHRVREGDLLAVGGTGEVRFAGVLAPDGRYGRVEMYATGHGVVRDRVTPVPDRFPPVDDRGRDVEGLIAPSFVTVALGLKVARGVPGALPEHGIRFRYVVDGSVGWQAPLGTPAYWLEAGLGIALFGSDELSVRGFVGNVLAGLSDIRVGSRMGYTVRFGP